MMERSESPAYCWLLELLYVCFILNHTATTKLKWRTPLKRLTGTTTNISPILRSYGLQTVYYKIDDSYFPSDTREICGRFVGIAEHVGHTMTFKILADNTHTIIYGSNTRSAEDSINPRIMHAMISCAQCAH